MAGELAEVVRLLAGALRAAGQELEALAHTEVGEPDALARLRCEHAAMRATLTRLRVGEVLTPEQRRAMVTVYRDEVRRHPSGTHVELGTYPVLPDVRREVDEAAEAVRRLAITCPEVREALNGTDVWMDDRAPLGSGA
jgi:hypothetical protein